MTNRPSQEKLREQIAEFEYSNILDAGFPSYAGYYFKNVPNTHPQKIQAYKQADELLDLFKLAIQEAKREERERIRDTGTPIHLEIKDGKPIIMFADGDYYEQDGLLTSVLMHLSIVMPHCELPNKLFVIPEQALTGKDGK